MTLSFTMSYQDGMNAYDQAVDKGEADLIKMGFPPAERPIDHLGHLGDRPTLPPRMSVLTMAELQDLMGWFTTWHSYALEVLPQVAADRNAALQKKDFAWANLRGEKRGKTTKDKDDEVTSDGRFVAVNANFEILDYKFKKLTAICKGLEREIDTISRSQSALEQRTGAHGHVVAGERSLDRNRNQSVMNGFRSRRRQS